MSTQVFSSTNPLVQSNSKNPTIPVSLFAHTEDNGSNGFFNNINHTMTWLEFGSMLGFLHSYPFVSKKDGILFSPTVYAGTRCRRYASNAALLVIDSDGGLPFKDAVTALKKANLEGFVYTSARYSLALEKIRIVVPLKEAVGLLEQERAVRALVQYLAELFHLTVGKGVGEWDLDTRKLNAVSLFYVPGQYQGAEFNLFEQVEGDILSAADWIELFPNPTCIPSREIIERPEYDGPPEDASLVERKAAAALQVIENQQIDYDTWFRIGMALKAAYAENDDAGKALWSSWCLPYEGDDDLSVEKKWNGFNPISISPSTLYRIADEWDPAWRVPFRNEGFADSDFVKSAYRDYLDQMQAERDAEQDDEEVDEPLSEPTSLTLVPPGEETKNESNEPDLWGEPIDIFGALTHPPRISRDMFPKVIADYAWDQAELLGVEPAVLGMAAIIMMSGLVSDMVQLQPRSLDCSYHEAARLWGILIGHVGNKKSPLLKKLEKHIRKRQEEMREKFKAEMRVYEQQYAAYEVKRKAWLNRLKQDSNEAPPEKPEKPIEQRLLTDDPTPEVLGHLLRDNPRGMVVLMDEIMLMFGGFDAYKKGTASRDRPTYLAGYNGGPRDIDRVGSKDDRLAIPNWGFVVIGGIQYDKFDQIGEKLADDGLLERFILMPMKRDTIGVNRKLDIEAMTEYTRLCDNLIDFNPSEEIIIQFSPEGEELRQQIDELAQALKNSPAVTGPFRGYASKMPGTFARLALTIHMIENAPDGWSGNAYPESFRKIPEATAKRAYDLLVRWIIPNAVHEYDRLSTKGDQVLQDIRNVAGMILAHSWNTVSVRECQRGSREFRKDKRRAEVAIAHLENADWIKDKRVNPKVHTLFQELAEMERRTRKETQDSILHAKTMIKQVY